MATGMLAGMDTTTLLALLGTLVLGVVLGLLIGWLAARAREPQEDTLAALEVRSADQAVIKDGLDRLADQLRDLQHERATWQGELNAQVQGMRLGTESLRRETASLSTALRKPQVRGRWGEMHLRRAVELAGMVDRCDFAEQHSLREGTQRPDLVVHLAGGRQIVVDAKVPLDAFLDATGADDDELRAHHLARHVRQLRTHVNGLADKAYWRSLAETPEFVVMFIPAEAFLSAALDTQADLLEFAAERRVILATPTTLIALLRTVAHGWSHQTLAAQVAEVQQTGRELYDRLGSMGAHFDKLGRSLGQAVQSYNRAVGSLESRVLVSARRFESLGVVDDPALPGPSAVEETPRQVAAPELTVLEAEDDLAARRAEGA